MSNQTLITNYYISHRDELRGYVRSRLGDNCQVDDIIQDVFLKLLCSKKMITEITLPSLVYTMMRNMVVDHLRHHMAVEHYEHYIKGVCSNVVTEDLVLSIQEILEIMENGLARLPENCREIYRLHIYDGMQVSEISRELGEGYKSVEHRLGSTRKAMRHYLQKYA